MLGDSLQNIKSQWKKVVVVLLLLCRCGAVGLCVLWWDGGEEGPKKLPVFGLFFPV